MMTVAEVVMIIINQNNKQFCMSAYMPATLLAHNLILIQFLLNRSVSTKPQ